jgi:hypothetical protein
MKILRWVIPLVVIVLVVAVNAQAQLLPKSNIVNSAHDLRSVFMTPAYSLCNYCHIIHKTGPSPVGPGPYLWNHTLSSVASYGVYSSPFFDQLKTDIADLGGQTTESNLCLSCHDGTVAIDSFYMPVTSSSGTTFMPIAAVIKDLTKTHPVNFTYNAALATAAGLLVPNSTTSVDAAGSIPLFGGKMQCNTCHDPHNGKSGIFERGFPSQTSGTFCTYCHL